MTSLQSFVIILSIAALIGLFIWDSIERNSSIVKNFKNVDSAIQYYVNNGFRLTVKTENTAELIRQKKFNWVEALFVGFYYIFAQNMRRETETVIVEFDEEGIITKIRKE
jgi:hypothetical protein